MTSHSDLLGIMFYGAAVALLLIGLYTMLTRRHLIRVLLGLTLVEAGVNLALVAAGFRPEAAAPILGPGAAPAMVDPVPQALILTAIVIGVGILAFALSLVVRIHRTYGSVDLQVIGERLASDPDGTGSEIRRRAP